MRSSSRPLPKRLSTFFTAGGGPLLFPEGSICTLGREVSTRSRQNALQAADDTALA